MNVAQLIKELKTCKPDAEVRFLLPEPFETMTNYWVDVVDEESVKGGKDNIKLITKELFDEEELK